MSDPKTKVYKLASGSTFELAKEIMFFVILRDPTPEHKNGQIGIMAFEAENEQEVAETLLGEGEKIVEATAIPLSKLIEHLSSNKPAPLEGYVPPGNTDMLQ